MKSPVMILCLAACLCSSPRGMAAGGAPEPPAACSPEIAAKIVRRAYQKELARAPDRVGMQTYVPLIASGRHDEAWLRGVLRDSEENKPRLRQMRREERIRTATTLSLLTLVWTTALGIFWAAGDGLCRGLQLRPSPGLHSIQKMTLGLAAVLGVLQLASLLFPLNGAALIVFLAGGAVVTPAAAFRAWRDRRALRAGGGPADRGGRTGPRLRRTVFGLLAILFVLVAAAASARRNVESYDTMLYHLSSVRWINAFPAVPGLANLHMRLGTNSAWLLLSALLDNGPLDRRSAWFMPGIGCLLFLLYLSHTLLFPREGDRRTRILAALLLPFGLLQMVTLAPSLYFDHPAHYLLAICLVELVRWLESPRRDLDAATLAMIAVPAAASFIIKPVGAPFLALAGVLTAWSLVRRLRAGTLDWRTGGAHLFPAFLLLGWVLRNTILSGWLLFPAQALRLPVDWAVPAEPADNSHAALLQSVSGQLQVLQSYARRPGVDYTGAMDAPLRAWLPDWYRARSASVELRWLLPLGTLGLLAGAVLRRARRTEWPDIALGLLIAANLAFWFHSAPDLRYGSVLFWMWFAHGGMLVLSALPGRFDWPRPFALGLLACAVFSAGNLALIPQVFRNTPWRIGEAFPRKIVPVTVANGQVPPLVLNTPSYGDQCGDAELPCTPYPRDALLLRTPGELGRGFRVAGNREEPK